MTYRFKIYKQSNFAASFNKYDLTEYAYLFTVVNNAQWNLKIDKDKDFPSIKRELFSGAISCKGVDYNNLMTLEGENYQYAVVIEMYCQGKVYQDWTERWKGFFSYFDFKPDRDKCTVSFEPTAWDDYTQSMDQMSVDRNLLACEAPYTVLMDSYEYPSEQVSDYHFTLGVIAPVWSEYTDLPSPNDYYLVEKTCIFSGYVPSGGGGFFLAYDEYTTYKRDYAFTDSDITPPSLSPNWILDPQLTPNGSYSPGVWKWVRPYLDGLYTTFAPPVIKGNDYYYTLQTSTSGTISLMGCVTLKAVMDYYCAFFGLTYVSNFFNDTPCPMGGESLSLTMLDQISNIIKVSEPGLEVAKKSMVKFKDLLLWLRDTFNVYWYIDSNGDFRVEHKKYFDYGLSYTYTHVITLDLKTLYPDNVRAMNRYEWSKPSLFRFEKLEIQYSYMTDWVEARIEYDAYSIQGNETTTRTVEWGTDIISMYDGRAELPKQGWALLNVHNDPISGLKVVVNTLGACTGNSIQNGRFSTANLLRDLWTYGRLLSSGKVNGVATNFYTKEKLKKQPEITFPLCCTILNYNGLFRTELGDGEIESGEFESKSGNLKVNLIYE